MSHDDVNGQNSIIRSFRAVSKLHADFHPLLICEEVNKKWLKVIGGTCLLLGQICPSNESTAVSSEAWAKLREWAILAG